MAPSPYLNINDFLLAKQMTLGEMILAHERQFVVPLNQRPWAWSDSKDVQFFLEDFWNIVTAFFDVNSSPKWKLRQAISHPPHFFGTFVFYERPDNKYEIFDGQQRITAISMLCAILREIAHTQQGTPGAHQNQASNIYGGFNEWLRIEPSGVEPRLLPNSLFRGLFDALIFESLDDRTRQAAIAALPQDVRDHVISKKLINSFTHMRSWIVKKTDPGTPSEITTFLFAAHDVLRYLFTCIETRLFEEEYSYTVFGCLNTRGKSLTAADNIKNELFKASAKPLHKDISDTWDRIGMNIPGQDVGEFLRRRHIALIARCKKRETYQKVKAEEIDKSTPKILVDDWYQDSKIVRQIIQREASLAKQETLERLEIIFNVLNVGLAYIPLLAAVKNPKLSREVDFPQCVLWTENFVFRALTIEQMDTAELEHKLGESARIIWGSGSVTEFKDYLKNQINDTQFEAQFAKHSERRVKIQYYILGKLEIQRLGGGKGVVPGDHHSAKNHIEHILPKRLSSAQGRANEWPWARANPEKHRNLVNRLGNLLVLEGDINRSVNNHEFSVKQKGQYKKNKSGNINQIKCYKDSALYWPQEICNVKKWHHWTEDEIDARQKIMAKDALGIWSI